MQDDVFDADEVRALYERAVRQRDQAVETCERAAKAVGHLDQVIAGLVGLAPGLLTEQSPVARTVGGDQGRPAPRTLEAVVAAVRGREGGWMGVKAVIDVLRNRGELPEGKDPDSAVRAALRRAAEQRLIEKGQLDGRSTAYRLVTQRPADAESPAATGLSDAPSPPAEEGGSGNGEPDADRDPRDVPRRYEDHDRTASPVVVGAG